MSKIKICGLHQYGAGPFKQQQFGTAGVERVKTGVLVRLNHTACSYPGSHRRLWLLHQVPETTLPLCTAATSEVLVAAASLASHALRLFTHLLEHVLLALVIAVLAARLQVELVDAPVLKVVGERQDADVVDKVQLTGPVEIEHRRKRARMSIEEELHRRRVEIVAQRAERVAVRRTATQAAETRVRHAFQSPPEGLVTDAADVEHDAT